MMYQVRHLLSHPEKTSTFNSDVEFIAFVTLIVKENNDAEEFTITTVEEAKTYITTYCDNLELLERNYSVPERLHLLTHQFSDEHKQRINEAAARNRVREKEQAQHEKDLLIAQRMDDQDAMLND